MRAWRSVFIATVLLLCFRSDHAFSQAYITPFTSAITYQNVGTDTANVRFVFYEEDGSAVTVDRTLSPGAGSSLFLGTLSNNFAGTLSSVMSADQEIAATVVQIPQSSAVKNRPLANAFGVGADRLLFASLLKNQFNSTSKFSVQNTASYSIDIAVDIYDANNPDQVARTVNANSIPAGSAVHFDMNDVMSGYSSFNGSAIVEGFSTNGSAVPAPIVGAVLELSTTKNAAKAFEATSRGDRRIYMATALCESFNNTTTTYAVQNVSFDGQAKDVVVTYSGGAQETQQIEYGAKYSFNACNATNNGYSGAATIEIANNGNGELVAVGKAFKPNTDYATAFLGVTYGAPRLALPYVRFASDNKFFNQNRQRTFIAIQNVGDYTAENVVVRYLNKNGDEVGTHYIGALAPNDKANSKAIDAGSGVALEEFGSPDANPGGGFGGAVLVEGDGELSAVARVTTWDDATGASVGEDYNATPVH